MEVENIIYKDYAENHRKDAIDRVLSHKSIYGERMIHICDTICMNVPYYKFYMQMPNKKYVALSMFSHDCDPVKTSGALLYGLPLVSAERRSLSLPQIYRVNCDPAYLKYKSQIA